MSILADQLESSSIRDRSRSPLPSSRHHIHEAGVAHGPTRDGRREFMARSVPIRGRPSRTMPRVDEEEEEEVQVLRTKIVAKAVVPVKKEKKREDDDVELIGPPPTRWEDILNQRSRPHSHTGHNPLTNHIEAKVTKRLGTRSDPIVFDHRNRTSAYRGESCMITVFSEDPKEKFKLVMLDPTYGQYRLDALHVERCDTGEDPAKTYEFEFTPTMFGPHLIVLSHKDFYLVQTVRVTSRDPPPPRRMNRPPLPRLDVHGVPREMASLFHAPRPRREDEKHVDAAQVLESLLG